MFKNVLIYVNIVQDKVNNFDKLGGGGGRWYVVTWYENVSIFF